MKRLFGLLAIGVALSLGASARADITFTFFEDGGVGANPYGTTFSFHDTTSTYLLPTSVITITPPAQQLNVKGTESFPAGVESGLGIIPDVESEINPKGYVHFDFGSLKALGFQHLTFTFGSEQVNEGTQLYADNTGATPALSPPPGSLVYSSSLAGPNQSSFTVPDAVFAANRFYNVIAYGTGNGMDPNILVNSVVLESPSRTPEPSTFAIAGLGIVGFGAYSWRRRRADKGHA
jgi:hypothetical protein